MQCFDLHYNRRENRSIKLDSFFTSVFSILLCNSFLLHKQLNVKKPNILIDIATVNSFVLHKFSISVPNCRSAGWSVKISSYTSHAPIEALKCVGILNFSYLRFRRRRKGTSKRCQGQPPGPMRRGRTRCGCPKTHAPAPPSLSCIARQYQVVFRSGDVF